MKHVKATLWMICICTGLWLPGGELAGLLRRAQEENPSLSAARRNVEQVLLQHQELLESLDPTLYAGLGYGSRVRSLPLQPPGYATVGQGESLEGQAGLVVPLAGGAYVAAGALARRWFDPGEGYDPLYQNLFGVNVKIPLLRDRGFALLGLRRQAAYARYGAAVHRLLEKSHALRHDVEQAYIALCEAESGYQVTLGATQRFQQLNQEAKELARLKTIPQYQVHETARDLQAGKDDEEIALNHRRLQEVTLAETIGTAEGLAGLSCRQQDFLAAAEAELSQREAIEALRPPEGDDLLNVCRRRGEWLALAAEQEATAADYRYERESEKDEISLNLGATWQAEGEHHPFGGGRRAEAHRGGAEVLLTWQRPLYHTGSVSRAAQHQARLRELEALQRQSRVAIASSLRAAQLRLQSAVRRLAIVNDGVAAARATVDAEQERFRLGEGSSYSVLEAQKNLNAILQRQTAAAAEVLRARSDLEYALGYP